MRPCRWQPTRLPRPWDSPGKNTGVGCHFLLQCMKVKSESEVAQSCPTLRDPMGCSLPGSSVHGIFQARVLEWGAIAFSGSFSSNLITMRHKSKAKDGRTETESIWVLSTRLTNAQPILRPATSELLGYTNPYDQPMVSVCSITCRSQHF